MLKYLGKPPSHLCSGFFSELPECFCYKACVHFPVIWHRWVPHAHVPPSAHVTPEVLCPHCGCVCAGVWTACPHPRPRTRPGLPGVSILPHGMRPGGAWPHTAFDVLLEVGCQVGGPRRCVSQWDLQE